MTNHKNEDIKDKIIFTTGEDLGERHAVLDADRDLITLAKAMEVGRAHIEVDLALLYFAPIPAMNWLMGLQIELKDPTEDGHVSEAEADRIHELKQAFMQTMDEEAHGKYVGSVTYGGMVMVYFYGPEEELLPPLVGSFAALHDDYDFNFMTENDGQWNFYFNALYPNELELTLIRNQEILARLYEDGVDLTKPVPVNYYFYFQEGPDRAKSSALFALEGFEIVDDKMYVEKMDPLPMGLHIRMTHPLDPITMAEKTYDIYDIIGDSIAVVDGWDVDTGHFKGDK